MRDNAYDIIVIGAGPAGSAAAKQAQVSGAKVCLLERNKTPGVPVRCGEGIGMQSLVNYSDPRPEWIKATIKRSVMVAPDGTEVSVSDIDHSVILDREKMDGDLAKEAQQAGVSLFVQTPVLKITRSHDGIYCCYSSKKKFTGKILIIADGVESRCARELGWDTALSPEDIQSCAFTRVYSDSIDGETCVFHIGSQIAPGGYLWVFPWGKGVANVGLGILGSKSTAGMAREALEKFIAHKFTGARTADYHCGGVPVASYQRTLVKDGALIIGDAARQVNCLSGAGIGYSLFAGKTAGQYAAEALLEDGTVNYRHLVNYEHQWKKKFGKQQMRSLVLKKFVVQHADDIFLNKIARSLKNRKPGKTRYLTVFLKTFSRNPLLMFKAFKLFK